jgi:hypothetical protein
MTPQQLAILQATLDAQQQTEQLDADSLAELQRLYRQAADDIARRIAAYSGSDGNIPLYQLQNLLKELNARLEILSSTRNALLNQSLTSATILGTRPLTDALAASGISTVGMISTTTALQINRAALQFVRTHIEADGLQLSDRIWRIDRQARDLINNAVESAVIRGQGAAEAARELLQKGQAVTAELADKMGEANAQTIAKGASELLTGSGSPMDNAMRVMRTEINRAHGTSYAAAALAHPDAAGVRYKLSPAHPRPDICDLLSSQNLHGLGPGVYPTVEDSGWPAHPNILSFLEIVFKDQVTEEDQSGKETSMEALDRLTPAQQIGVLGVNKHAAFKDGKLKPDMIAKQWSAVQKQIS